MSAEHLCKRLRASIRMDAINGDRHERAVCAKQMKEAADEIERLRARISKLEIEHAWAIGQHKQALARIAELEKAALDVQRVRDELLAIAKQYASECEICGGSGQLRGDGWQKPCDACADIRAAISRAEGRSDE